MECFPEPIVIEPRPFTERYVAPVINHPVSRFVKGSVAELVKIVAAGVFLDCLLEEALRQAKTPMKRAWEISVMGPVLEEILCRGCIQRGIGLAQKGWNHFVTRRELTQEELAVQRIWRVQISAIIFAAFHLRNPHPNMAAKLGQFTWSYIGGVAYGYLSDKYESLSVSILAHGFNNMLAVCALSYQDPKITFICIAGMVINDIAAYTLGTTEWARNTAARMREFRNTCLSMPSRVFNNLNVARASVPEMA